MEEEHLKTTVYSTPVIEFTTVAVQFCAYLEQLNNKSRTDFVDTTLKLLPLLYLKASLLPPTTIVAEEEQERFVDEATYTLIASQISTIMQEEDTYLEVFLEDMKYSETPISAFISEDIADIYQDLKDFTCIYATAITQNMNDALHNCSENFKTYWGQKLVNVLRALHNIHYNNTDNPDYTFREDTLW